LNCSENKFIFNPHCFNIPVAEFSNVNNMQNVDTAQANADVPKEATAVILNGI
jgi:hypothetical protein